MGHERGGRVKSALPVLTLAALLAGCSSTPAWEPQIHDDMRQRIRELPVEVLTDSCLGLADQGIDTPEEAMEMMREEFGPELTMEAVYPGIRPEEFQPPEGAELEDVIRIAAEELLRVCEEGPAALPGHQI